MSVFNQNLKSSRVNQNLIRYGAVYYSFGTRYVTNTSVYDENTNSNDEVEKYPGSIKTLDVTVSFTVEYDIKTVRFRPDTVENGFVEYHFYP